METYFAAAQRADQTELINSIGMVNRHPVITGLLSSISGLLAVLDEHRQIVALNDDFLKMMGIDDPEEVLGLRPGEALQCIYAHDEPAGCGTTKLCSTCGAAVAIVSSLGQDKPVERFCSLKARRADTTIDLAFLVRSHPVRIDEKRFLLLFVQDITLQQQRAALERTFFHDIKNILTGLIGACELLLLENHPSDLPGMIFKTAMRLNNEMEVQRLLLQDTDAPLKPEWMEIRPDHIMNELQAFFANHPAARNKHLRFSACDMAPAVRTDPSLLLRVLGNMVTNALEATGDGGCVKLWFEQTPDRLSFCVWNDRMIPAEIAPRIFQRNFSTKSGDGRGIGTYSMKMFGEGILGGKVQFTTSETGGTVFRFSLPR